MVTMTKGRILGKTIFPLSDPCQTNTSFLTKKKVTVGACPESCHFFCPSIRAVLFGTDARAQKCLLAIDQGDLQTPRLPRFLQSPLPPQTPLSCASILSSPCFLRSCNDNDTTHNSGVTNARKQKEKNTSKRDGIASHRVKPIDSSHTVYSRFDSGLDVSLHDTTGGARLGMCICVCVCVYWSTFPGCELPAACWWASKTTDDPRRRFVGNKMARALNCGGVGKSRV